MTPSASRPSRRTAAASIAAVAFAFMLVGCAATASDAGSTNGDETDSGGNASESAGNSIVGTWVLEKEFPTAPNTPFLTVSESGDWSGSDGCNGSGGTWEIDSDGALTVTAGASTLMACDGAPLPRLFSNAATAIRAGDELTLTGTDGTVTYLELGESDFSTTN